MEKDFAMKSRKTSVMAFALVAVIACVGNGFSSLPQPSASVRSFEFTYLTRIPGLPAEGKISKIWIPLPQSDSYQAISELKIESPFPYTTHRDSEYGNEYAYLEVPAAKMGSPAEVRVNFQARRQEHRVALAGNENSASMGAGTGNLQRFLQPDRRVPLQGVIGELSAQETRGIQDPLAKARTIYDYVIATMRYDKSGTGCYDFWTDAGFRSNRR